MKLRIPIGGGECAELTIPVPLAAQQFDHIENYLKLMKSAWFQDETADEDDIPFHHLCPSCGEHHGVRQDVPLDCEKDKIEETP